MRHTNSFQIRLANDSSREETWTAIQMSTAMILLRAGCLATACCLGLTSLHASAPKEQTITFPAVVRVLVGTVPGEAKAITVGTGTIIAKQTVKVGEEEHGFLWVLTCDHVVSDNGKQAGRLSDKIGISLGNAPKPGALSDGFPVNPDDIARGGPSCKVDMAVLKVDMGPSSGAGWRTVKNIDPIKITPLNNTAKARDELLGAQFSVIGFGLTGEKLLDKTKWIGWEPIAKSTGIQRFHNGKLRAGPEVAKLNGYIYDELSWLMLEPNGKDAFLKGTGAVLPADSGGPMLFDAKDTINAVDLFTKAIRGIAVRGLGEGANLFDFQNGGVAITKEYADWIQDQINAAGPEKPQEDPLVVDVIPTSLSAETNQDAEPSLAVQPSGDRKCREICITTFSRVDGRTIRNGNQSDNPWSGVTKAPIWISSNDGRTWSVQDRMPKPDVIVKEGPLDQTLAYKVDGTGLYYVGLGGNRPGTVIGYVGFSDDMSATDVKFPADLRIIVNGKYVLKVPDQPWIQLGLDADTGKDRVYVGYYDSSLRDRANEPSVGKTAYVFVSIPGKTGPVSLDDGGHKFGDVDRQVRGQSGSSVRIAILEDRVYAVFARYTSELNRTNDTSVSGDIVLTRDDSAGAKGFRDLKDKAGNIGVIVNGGAAPIELPRVETLLGQQRLGSDVAIAIDPSDKSRNTVYVAYLALTEKEVRIHVLKSEKAGAEGSWNPALKAPIPSAALPALAVSANGTLGILYTRLAEKRMSTELRTVSNKGVEAEPVVLASWPADSPKIQTENYIGDFQQLIARDKTFYGAFAASNEPKAANFPQGVRFQRLVSVDKKPAEANSRLGGSFGVKDGELVDKNGKAVAISIDPFFFKVTPAEKPKVRGKEPYSLPFHIYLAGLPSHYYRIEYSEDLQNWAPLGDYLSMGDEVEISDPAMGLTQRFYRARALTSDDGGSSVVLSAFAGPYGSLSPSGDRLVTRGQNLTLTATPHNNLVVDCWYVDDEMVQVGGTGYTLADLEADHSVYVTFRSSKGVDLAVKQSGSADGVTIGEQMSYSILASNKGKNAAHGVVLSAPLLPNMVFVRALSSQGTCTNENGVFRCDLGSLGGGESAEVVLIISALAAGIVTNAVCLNAEEEDVDLLDNCSSELTCVECTPTILSQPESMTVTVGETATFSVAVLGMSPLNYQWRFNQMDLLGETNSVLELPSAMASQAGEYAVRIQTPLGFVTSDAASLTVIEP